MVPPRTASIICLGITVPCATFLRNCAGGERRIAAALEDGAVEQPFRAGRHDIGGGGPGAGRLAAQGDVTFVAPERRDVPLHPLQRRLHVHDAVVAGCVAFLVNVGMGHEAEQVQAIIESDHHQLALRRQPCRVVVVALAIDIAAAVNPHQHWQFRFYIRREDVEIKTVLVRIGRPRERTQCRDLGAGRAERVGLARVSPFRVPLRRHPAQSAHRRLGEGNAQELGDAILGDAVHRTFGGRHRLGADAHGQ
jgi:hypothetical protein